jgi:hypothetical protein
VTSGERGRAGRTDDCSPHPAVYDRTHTRHMATCDRDYFVEVGGRHLKRTLWDSACALVAEHHTLALGPAQTLWAAAGADGHKGQLTSCETLTLRTVLHSFPVEADARAFLESRMTRPAVRGFVSHLLTRTQGKAREWGRAPQCVAQCGEVSLPCHLHCATVTATC